MLSLRHAARNLRYILDNIFGGPMPPLSLNLLAPTSAYPIVSRDANRPTSRLEDLLGVDLGVLWGMPTHKTIRSKKITRKFGIQNVLKRKNNLIMCQKCGFWHEIHTICGKCYEAVREETKRIQEKLLAYNPYKGEVPDKEALLLYKGESMPEDGVWQGKRIVELPTERPSWFSRDLKQRWRLAVGGGEDSKSKTE